MVDGDLDIDIEAPPPALELGWKENVVGAARAAEQNDAAIALARREEAVDRRASGARPSPPATITTSRPAPPRPASRRRTVRAGRTNRRA